MIRTSSRPAFTIPNPLKIEARLVIVIAAVDRQVIGDGRQDIILANLAPAVEPVDVGYRRLR